MILGMPPLLALHVIISLVCILAGLVVVWGLFGSKLLPGWTLVFVATALITDITGFPLPPFGVDPPRILGVISLVVLIPLLASRYAFHLKGVWRPVYAVTAVMTLYFNVFVLITQGFLKVPALHALAPNAPTTPELPFAIAQGAALIAFVVIGYLSAKRFKPA
jgi:hypothetical protein